jgi:hypothetical protein
LGFPAKFKGSSHLILRWIVVQVRDKPENQ